MSPPIPDQLLTHTLIHKGVKGLNTETTAGKSHKACRLICTNKRAGSQVQNASEESKWKISAETPPAQCNQESLWVMDDYLEVKEFAVSSVNDVRGVVRVCDIDEINLSRQETW